MEYISNFAVGKVDFDIDIDFDIGFDIDFDHINHKP